jgi:hypothetical protein
MNQWVKTFSEPVTSTCECGNSGLHEGFYSCDDEGRPVSGGGCFCCDRCGKVTEASTGKVLGHRLFTVAQFTGVG